MQRDGNTNSLWQFNIPAYHARHTAIPDKIFDVIIVGGGITGIGTALQLQQAGKSCIVLEARNLCFGTTGGTTAHLNTLIDSSYDIIEKNYGEKNAQLVAEATRDSIELIRSNVQEYNIDCDFKELPAYLFSHDKKQTEQLLKLEDASAHAGLQISEADKIPVPIPFDRAIEIARQAQIHPTKYVYGIAEVFEDKGGVIIQNCLVKDADENNGIITSKTSLGIVKGYHLIYATHIPPHVNILDTLCAPYRSYALAIQLKDDTYPDALIYDMDDPYHYYRTHEVLGKKYLIAGGEDHKTGHVENTEACFLRLESYVRKYFDVDAVIFKWSSQYYEPKDYLPYIGHLPGASKNIFTATGFSGNGITYSHVAAIVLTDLITKGEGKYVDLFSPSRIKPLVGFTNFVKENADVVSQFFGKRLSKEKLTGLADLAPGEAKVVKYEGEAMALYKDENGELHALNPVCPHMKCEVSWNMAEKTWDCPCHGSRFNIEGEVITGPATKSLETIMLKDLIDKE